MAERTEREADVETVAATDTESGSSLIPKVFNRLNELSVVKSMCEQVSGVYERTRERNRATQLGLGAAEVSVKTALHTTRLVYSALPSTGFTGKLKEELEEKVSKVDTMACDGLEFLLNKWPLVKDSTDKVVAVGAEQLEQSDFVDIMLTVTEAAVDYFKPTQEKVDNEQSTDPPVAQTKLDRIRGVSSTIIDGGAEMLSSTASAGLDGAKSAAKMSWNATKSLFLKVPGVHGMLATFLESAENNLFIFSPPIIGDGSWVILVRKQKLRRSKRRTVKGKYTRVVDATNPFPVSPERKRKYDNEEGEGSLIEELIHISENYVSDEDSDYNPDNDEGEDSVDSLEDEDEDDDEEEADEDEEQDETEAKMSEEQNESGGKMSDEHEAATQETKETTQPEQKAIVNGVGKKEKGEQPTAKNCSKTETKLEVSATKVAQVKNAEQTAIGAKNKEEKAEAMKGTKGDWIVV